MIDDLVASVVIVAHRDERALRAVTALLKGTKPETRYEILVVENGSELLRDACARLGDPVRYIQVPTANMAAARNVGLAEAHGRFLLSTDADCVPRSGWVEAMVAALGDGLDAAGGRIRQFEGSTPAQRYGLTIVDGQQQLNYLPALELPYVAGANAGYRTSSVRAVGGFDESLPSGNDVDISYRLGLAGYRLGLAPAAVVDHEDRKTVWSHFQRFRRYAVYQVLLFAKYRGVSKRSFVINPYPWQRAAQALAGCPKAVCKAACGDMGEGWRVVLIFVEAAGVVLGDIEGALRFRQPYL